MEDVVLWKRGRTLGKGGFEFVSLASTMSSNDQQLADGIVHLPSLIAVKSCTYSNSQSLQDEHEYLRLFQQSPYIINTFGVNVTQEDGLLLYNLLLEHATGGSLADVLQNNYSGNGLSEDEVKKYTKDVLMGLSHIHSRDIIHCDIKPHNILLVGDGNGESTAKIADFGLALTFDESMEENKGIRGTKRYLAPESVLHEDYGPEVDIWALGCTIYELITRTPLWESNLYSEEDARADVLYRIAYEEPMIQNEKLFSDAQDFLKRCLAKDPGLRWTASMLLNHPFVKSSPTIQPAKTRKKKGNHMFFLRRPHQKTAFKTQPHIRHLVKDH